ncbi:(deoxy)nucleoside-phosphate kinase [Silurid herpesvirus 1]|nr:(deoxy)nucleoside-phosphate kinase [Silurid herpesvirus 1]
MNKRDAPDPVRYTIAFAGRMGSGKDHACDYLIERVGGVKVHIFASGLDRAMDFLGRPIDKSRDRPFLQAMGDLGRRVDPHFWMRRTINDIITPLSHLGLPIFITGVRYIPEIEVLKTMGIETVLLRRPSIITGGSEEMHPSERAFDGYKGRWEIVNDGTVQEFETKVWTVFNTIF